MPTVREVFAEMIHFFTAVPPLLYVVGNAFFHQVHGHERNHQHNQEQHDGHSRGVAHLHVAEAVHIQIHRIEQKRVLRPAGDALPHLGNTGKHIRLREILKGRNKPHHHQELNGGRNVRQSDLKETLDRTRAVQLCRLVE